MIWQQGVDTAFAGMTEWRRQRAGVNADRY
jgi:hypothetical protein